MLDFDWFKKNICDKCDNKDTCDTSNDKIYACYCTNEIINFDIKGL